MFKLMLTRVPIELRQPRPLPLKVRADVVILIGTQTATQPPAVKHQLTGSLQNRHALPVGAGVEGIDGRVLETEGSVENSLAAEVIHQGPREPQKLIAQPLS